MSIQYSPVPKSTQGSQTVKARLMEEQRMSGQDEDLRLARRVATLIQGQQYSEAQQTLNTITWSSENARRVGLARIWSVAMEQSLTDEAKNWLRHEMPIGLALPYLNPSWRPKEWKFAQLLKFNPDLMLEMSEDRNMEYAWLAFTACMRDPNQHGSEAITLWNNLLATKSVQGNLKGKESLVLVGALEGGNPEAIAWVLTKLDTPLRSEKPQTTFEFLAYGLNCVNKEEMTGNRLGKLLIQLMPQVINDINWAALYEGMDEEVVNVAKTLVERERLEQEVTPASVDKENKPHL